MDDLERIQRIALRSIVRKYRNSRYAIGKESQCNGSYQGICLFQVVAIFCLSPLCHIDKDDFGMSPLHCAIYNGHMEAAISLLDHFADKEATDAVTEGLDVNLPI